MKKKGARRSASAEAMDTMIRQILFSFFRLSAAGTRLFAEAGQTPGKVSLMRSLYEEGPQSVAQIARARPVARQGVQRMADQLAADGLVEFAENPAHLRAKLVQLTDEGRTTIEELLAGELEWAGKLAPEFDEKEVETVTDVMRRLQSALLARGADAPAATPRRTRKHRA